MTQRDPQGEIKWTKDYGLFELHAENRKVAKTKWLERSMSRHGYIAAYPLHVTKSPNGKFLIKAGHHRFAVAKSLGIRFAYIVCNDEAQIAELEQATRKWTVHDFLQSYCSQGLSEYLKLREYIEASSIALVTSITLLGGRTLGETGLENFKTGRFKVRRLESSKKVAKMFLASKLLQPSIAPSRGYCLALMNVLYVPEFDVDQYLKKVKVNHEILMDPAHTIADFQRIIERIYNCRSNKKIPLSFMATEASKNRIAKRSKM